MIPVVVVLLVVDEVVPSQGVRVSRGILSLVFVVGNALLQELLLVELEFARHGGGSVDSCLFSTRLSSCQPVPDSVVLPPGWRWSADDGIAGTLMAIQKFCWRTRLPHIEIHSLPPTPAESRLGAHSARTSKAGQSGRAKRIFHQKAAQDPDDRVRRRESEVQRAGQANTTPKTQTATMSCRQWLSSAARQCQSALAQQPQHPRALSTSAPVESCQSTTRLPLLPR